MGFEKNDLTLFLSQKASLKFKTLRKVCDEALSFHSSMNNKIRLSDHRVNDIY